jgi:hypothetical protein
MKVHSRANQAFRQAAHSVTHSHSSIGAYYRAMRARPGPKQAIVATAHKIARIVYHLLKTGEPYREESDAEYDRKRQEREIKHLARRAQKLGYTQPPCQRQRLSRFSKLVAKAVSDERPVGAHHPSPAGYAPTVRLSQVSMVDAVS